MEKINTTFLNYSNSDYTKPDKAIITEPEEQSPFPLFPQVEFLNFGNTFTSVNMGQETEACSETEKKTDYEAKIISINEEPYYKTGRMRKSL